MSTTIINANSNFAFGKFTFGFTGGEKEVFFIAPMGTQDVEVLDVVPRGRFYISEILSQTAFRELTQNGATVATLGNAFNGRDYTDMKKFLEQNHVAPKAVVVEEPEAEAEPA